MWCNSKTSMYSRVYGNSVSAMYIWWNIEKLERLFFFFLYRIHLKSISQKSFHYTVLACHEMLGFRQRILLRILQIISCFIFCNIQKKIQVLSLSVTDSRRSRFDFLVCKSITTTDYRWLSTDQSKYPSPTIVSKRIFCDHPLASYLQHT